MTLTVDGILVDIVLLIIVIGNALIGYRKGIVKIAFNLFSSIIAIIVVLILCKPTTNFIMNHTEIPNSIESSVSSKVELVLQTNLEQQNDQLEENQDIINIIKIFTGDELGTILQQTAGNIVQTISYEITYKIISAVVFFGLFAIARLLLFILKTYMEWITEFPFLDLINETGGMIYGVISGILFLYMGFAIVSLLMPIYGNTLIVKAIEESIVGSRMLNHNILLGFIFKFL